MKRALQTVIWTILGTTVYIGITAVVLANGWGFSDKELFDWLDILIFPAVLALSVFWLNSTDLQAPAPQNVEVALGETNNYTGEYDCNGNIDLT